MNPKLLKEVKDYIALTFAILITAFSVYFFLIPSDTSISSISGLAIVLKHLVPFKVSSITLFFNVLLLILGFLTCGREFGSKTVYTSILFPIYIAIFEHLFPDYVSMTGSDIIDVCAYVVFVSFSMALLFNLNASSGGLDIVAKIMNKYLHIEIGKALSISGMIVSLSSIFVFPPRNVILSILGTFINGIIIDYFIFGQSIKRRVCILSLNHSEEIKEFIINNLHSGASIYEPKGAYSNKTHEEIITIVDKREYQILMDYIITTDPAAFVTVYNVSTMRYVPKIE